MINLFHDIHAVIRDASGELANEQVRYKVVLVAFLLNDARHRSG